VTNPFTLFEVSWEVCNKVGGIHTVLSTKAKTLVERMGDDYVAIGPWLMSGTQANPRFEEEPGFDAFCESCRKLGVPVRVGRWNIPGRPRTLLVQFSGLFEQKDGILAGLWERFRVDSLLGDWDYIEPVLFGHAAALVIERWCEEYVAPRGIDAVAQFHEWMTGSGLLHLKQRVPAVGTIFTTHATMLGRSIASGGVQPADGLGERTPEAAAAHHNIVAKHSMEGVCARESDVFTTVSQITADEAELFHRRRAQPLLPNGIDLAVVDDLAGPVQRADARAALVELAGRVLGEDCSRAALVCISGRYEFHNKGIDLLIDALAELRARPGRPIVCFVLVPAGNSGLRAELIERLRMPLERIEGPIGSTTHNLFDAENDPVQSRCARLGLDNAHGARVKIIQVPIYLGPGDGLLELPYEAVLRAVDLSCFPSFYEPWGYTPEESLAVGVPTLSTDCAGFGRWALERGLGEQHGVHVLPRLNVPDERAASELAEVLERVIARGLDAQLAARCRDTARLTAWSDLIANYDEAFAAARKSAARRAQAAGARPLRPRPIATAQPLAALARPRLASFEVAATLPAPLAGLKRLASNWWWCWNPRARALFERLAPRMWEASYHNPLVCLREVFGEDLAQRAADRAYVAEVEAVLASFDAYMGAAAREIELEGGVKLGPERPIAYLCAEFALHESLPIYSGGLGVLAGDHLKSASDLNLPLVAVGLFYRKGYFRQRIGPDGEQIALDAENHPRDLAIELVRDERGAPLHLQIELPSSTLTLRAWKTMVGRVPLYLLDSDVAENREEDRNVTHQLYGGDHELRLKQEIVLGKGSVRLLGRMGLDPAVFHLNEGHAAFAPLERVAKLVRERGLTFDEARLLVRSTTAFTTHTPVPAGHDRFGEDLMRRYFSDAAGWAGLPWERFMALGQAEDDRGSFNMTYLALNFCCFVNGVSQLHRDVSRKLLQPFWPKLLELEVPVQGLTNGVHLPTWTDESIALLLGARNRPVRGEDFARAAPKLDARRFWEAKNALRARLVERIGVRLKASCVQRGESPRMLARMLAGLEGDPLLIGFARRFAPYKRAGLLLRDVQRLADLLSDAQRPVRVFCAGKAHPLDKIGQDLVKRVVEATRSEPLAGKVFFLDDYDVDLARSLVQGVDVWLNNPIRTLEASGTSGMKVAANGGLNLSIPDGWWIEAADGGNGWTIGDGHGYPDQELQDEYDGALIYRLLEEEVVPLFYERDAAGVPQAWIERIRHSLATIPPQFDTDRMVGEYRDRAYWPLAANAHELGAHGTTRARELAERQAALRKGFAGIKVLGSKIGALEGVRVGSEVDLQVDLDLGPIAPADVVVEFLAGHRKGERELSNLHVLELAPVHQERSVHSYVGRYRMQRSGSFSYGLRVRAKDGKSTDAGIRDLVIWI